MSGDDGIGAAMSLDAAGRDGRKALDEVKKLQSRVDALEKHIEELHHTMFYLVVDRTEEHTNLKVQLKKRRDIHWKAVFGTSKG